MRLFAPLALILSLVVGGCTNVGPGPEGLGPEPSRGAALADRIAETSRGTDWYGSLVLVEGKPQVEVRGVGNDKGVDVPGGQADVHMVAGASQALATRACTAIAAVVNDPTYGTSLSLSGVRVVIGDTWQTDFCRPPQTP
jgi:hypothetical protein